MYVKGLVDLSSCLSTSVCREYDAGLVHIYVLARLGSVQCEDVVEFESQFVPSREKKNCDTEGDL